MRSNWLRKPMHKRTASAVHSGVGTIRPQPEVRLRCRIRRELDVENYTLIFPRLCSNGPCLAGLKNPPNAEFRPLLRAAT